jgi:hypothetical protein
MIGERYFRIPHNVFAYPVVRVPRLRYIACLHGLYLDSRSKHFTVQFVKQGEKKGLRFMDGE